MILPKDDNNQVIQLVPSKKPILSGRLIATGNHTINIPEGSKFLEIHIETGLCYMNLSNENEVVTSSNMKCRLLTNVPRNFYVNKETKINISLSDTGVAGDIYYIIY